MSEHVSRYHALVQELAVQAIDMAVDASPHKPRRGEERYSLMNLMPAARALLGMEATATEPPPIFGEGSKSNFAYVDGRGSSRVVYSPYANYLHYRATGQMQPMMEWLWGDDVSLDLWYDLCNVVAGIGDLNRINEVVDTDHASLQPQDVNEAPDHWTYRELVGLHALYALVELCDAGVLPDQPLWRRRVVEITEFHQVHTQPDYTTYQPWGLAAFISNPQTRMFADQQLHDVRTHLSIEGPGGALMPALLLADATASLATRLAH